MSAIRCLRCFRRLVVILLVTCAVACEHGGGSGPDPAFPPGDQPAFPFPAHVDQEDLASGRIPFAEAFLLGDVLFETEFNGLDGVGALALPDGTTLTSRFSRVPPGGGRFTGPNGASCVSCHNFPFPTSAGTTAGNVFQDPGRAGQGPFNPRNTTSLFGSAALQRLAEEMTEDLQAIRAQAAAAAAPGGPPAVLAVGSKGVSFGAISASRDLAGTVTFSAAGVLGVDPDLVVRPYGWKGNATTLRDFVRGACQNELGMEADEVVAKDPLGRTDTDGDGVEGELSHGDVTALTIYVGAQEIPATLERLVRDRLVPPVPSDLVLIAARGAALFAPLGCAACHVPELQVLDPVFEEPTARGGGAYLDPDLDPGATSVDPARPLRFHLVREGDFPRLEPHPAAGARVPLFGDLKRHAMGRRLADAQETPVSGADGRPLVLGGQAVLVPRSTFLTAELWGVGNTGPWLHDGRAGSLEEAILLHGEDSPPPPGHPDRSEAQEARDAFVALSADDRIAVVEFLKGLQLFALPEAEEE